MRYSVKLWTVDEDSVKGLKKVRGEMTVEADDMGAVVAKVAEHVGAMKAASKKKVGKILLEVDRPKETTNIFDV